VKGNTLDGFKGLALGALRLFKPLFGATLMLSVTEKCQGRCARCAVRRQGPSSEPELSDEEIKKLLAEISRLGAREVSFFGGEPLLRPGLPGLVRSARELGLRATLTTNGLLLDKAAALELAAAGLTGAGVSLDDPSAEIHDRERGLPGLWDKASAAVKHLVAAGVQADVSFCATKERLRDGRAAEMVLLAEKLGARLRILSPMRAGSWDGSAEEVLTPADIKILRSLLAPGKAHWVVSPANTPDTTFICASFCRWKIDVTASGDVVPCTYFPVPFGNIRREGVRESVRRMWNSPLYKDFKGSQDCPLNDPSFRELRSDLFEALRKPRA